MTASVKGHANIVKLLVEANADKDLTNEVSETLYTEVLPLLPCALVDQYSECSIPCTHRSSISWPASLNMCVHSMPQPQNDRSALDLAQEQGHAEIVALLQS
jgi:ankyrin repeat protein